jgi:hypothetical protein
MIGWLICLFRGHKWDAKGRHEGDYCSRCGQWEFDR